MYTVISPQLHYTNPNSFKMLRSITTNRSLFHTLSPLINPARILGLCPITYTKQKNFVTIRWSWKIYMANCATALTLGTFKNSQNKIQKNYFSVCWGFWGFVHDMEIASFVSLGFTGSVDVVISSFDISDVLLSCLYFIVSMPFKCAKLSIVFHNLNKVDAIITPVFCDRFYSNLVWFSRCWFVFLPVLYTLDVFMWGNTSWLGVNNYFAYYVSYSIVVLHELQYYQVVKMAQLRVSGINKTVKENIKKDTSRIKLEFIFDLIHCYNNTTDAIETINSSFNKTVTLMLFSCYVHLVTCPYQLFVMITSNETSILNYVYCLWVLLQIFRLVLVVEVCHNCEEEIQNTRILVSQLLNCRLDKNVKKEANTFLFLMVKKKIKFSAYGLPKVGRHLLLSFSSRTSKI
nr:PREDICTED: uncharacterized protein LOC107399089 isoform X2 [Tribolium castaneum]|eukprot:XP_015840254.1 PREDICTED: uncharacterized protein LOC107399089 isoform X2 [Tribolium castaneum]